jgi:2-polyprenyl-3-methyl-5-hydroxy-6-metoxy-1,4-benzoquinol methylase
MDRDLAPLPAEPEMNEESLQRSWNLNASAWTRSVRRGEIESRRLVTDNSAIDAVLASEPHRVLDVGSGEGWLARALADRGLTVVGFDASRELIARAREAGGGEFHVATYREFEADPTALGDNFDVVVCNFSLLGDAIDSLLRSCARVLEPSGRLVVQTLHPLTAGAPYKDGWREESFEGLGFPAAMPWYFRTLGSWSKTMRGSGFVLAEIREPVYPESGLPASLILVAAKIKDLR